MGKFKIAQKVLLLLCSISIFQFSKAAEEKIEIEAYAEIDKSGYVGQAIEYTITLKSTYPNIADIRIAQSPQYSADLEILRGSVSNKRPKEITEKGKRYYCWTIQRNFIIPKKAGKYQIGSWDFVAFIPRERIVNDFFWGPRRVVEYEELPVACKGVGFKAEDLPSNKTGKEFSGCIGDFTIEGWFPPGKISQGHEAIAVFTISGYGSLENLKIPNISKLFSEGCRLREIDQNETRSQRDGKLFSEVTLTCSFMPEGSEFKIEPLSLLFFNPDTKKYELETSNFLQWDSSSEKPHSTMKSKEAIEI